ncbi:MAG: GDP-mannose 4,6-dehydratase [Parvibaculum sp.]
MNVLITGGAGFIGVNLVRRLLAEGTPPGRIRLLDDLSVGSLAALDASGVQVAVEVDWSEERPAIAHWPVDIARTPDLAAAMAGAGVIIHLAGASGVQASVDDPRSDAEQNVLGTLNCITAARDVGASRFVFASSHATLAGASPPFREDMAASPMSPYGVSKLAGEGYCAAFFQSYGLEAVALRFSNAYGPFSAHKSSVVSSFIRRALESGEAVVYGDGTQTRDLIFVDDVARAIRGSALSADCGGEIFHIATGVEVSVNELIDILLAAFERRGLPPFSVRHAPARPGEATRSFSDIAKAHRILGWKPEISLHDGVERTLDWFLGESRGGA